MGDPGRRSVTEALIQEIGADLLRRAAGARPTMFSERGLRGRLLAHALRDQYLRAALFRFIDVLPQLETPADVAQHFRAYLSGYRLGGLWGRLLGLGANPMLAPAVRASVQRFARAFLVEETPAALGAVLARLRRLPAAASFDAVGEEVLTEAEADHYLARSPLAASAIPAPVCMPAGPLTPGSSPGPAWSVKTCCVTATCRRIEGHGFVQRRHQLPQPRHVAP